MDCSVHEECVCRLHLLQEEKTEESNKKQVVLLFFFLAPSYCLLVLNAVLKIYCLLSPSWEAECFPFDFGGVEFCFCIPSWGQRPWPQLLSNFKLPSGKENPAPQVK